MKNNIDYTLYLCTDRNLMSSSSIEESVEQAVKGGCSVVQIREKECSSLEFYKTALNVKKITDKYNIPLIINDRADIAEAIDAHGVHIGQNDLPVQAVRKLVGENKVIGVSVSNLKEAVKAQLEGADYLGVGAMNPTNTKTDANYVTINELKEIRRNIRIPIVIIGGINKDTICKYKEYEIDGFAVVSGIIAQNDITKAAIEILELINKK